MPLMEIFKGWLRLVGYCIIGVAFGLTIRVWLNPNELMEVWNVVFWVVGWPTVYLITIFITVFAISWYRRRKILREADPAIVYLYKIQEASKKWENK